MFWLILCLVLIICLIVLLIKYRKVPFDYIFGFTGSNGTGKTVTAVASIRRILWKKYFPWRKSDIIHDYKILSNMPLGKPELDSKGNFTGKYYFYCVGRKFEVLRYDYRLFTCKCKLPQDEVIIICDEFSQMANQFEYKRNSIIKGANNFCREFRHWTSSKGYIVFTDQCSSDIFLQIRRRVGKVYNCSSFYKPRLLPINFTKYRLILLSDEVKNEVDMTKSVDGLELRTFFFIGNLFKYYDSHYLKERMNLIKDDFIYLSLDPWYNKTPYKSCRIPYSADKIIDAITIYDEKE